MDESSEEVDSYEDGMGEDTVKLRQEARQKKKEAKKGQRKHSGKKTIYDVRIFLYIYFFHFFLSNDNYIILIF